VTITGANGTAPTRSYDVVVVGGGAAGVAAAVGAADSGARTLLIENYGVLGGAATISGVLSYCGLFCEHPPYHKAVAGVADRVLAELYTLDAAAERLIPGNGNKFVTVDPEAVKVTLDRIVTRSGAHLLLHAQVIGAGHDGTHVTSVEVAHHGGRLNIQAKAFVDASGNGDLASLAGAATQSPEPGDPYTVASMMMRLSGIPQDVDTSPGAVRAAMQAHVAATGDILPKMAGIFARVPPSGDLMAILADTDGDPLDVDRLTTAEVTGRELAWTYLGAIRTHLPGGSDARLVSTGPQIGIREGRRLLGQEVITRDDVLTARRRPDAVARCGWPMESHRVPGKVLWESIGGHSYYDIPYGALLSKTYDNLWAAGRTISADRDAFSSARVMGTAFATGQAAGVAGARWCDTARHDVDAVRSCLLHQGALL